MGRTVHRLQAADRTASLIDVTEPTSHPTRSRRGQVLALGVVLGVLVLDVATKVWAVHELSDGPIKVFGDWFELRLSYNSGSAFSFFSSLTPLLAAFSIVVAVWLWRVVRRTTDLVMVVALSLVLGGALGNLADRIFRAPGFMRGEVVDFVRVGSWPIFNVADSAIVVGVILLVVRIWKAPPAEREALGS